MSTRSDLLTTAELLLRTKGYAAFSYADLAEEIGIKKASIHHHFPTKEGLGIAVIESYLFRFSKNLESINEENHDVIARLKAFAEMFVDSSHNGMLPLCGALAAELSALPDSLKELTKKFFDIHLQWLEKNLDLGKAKNVIKAEINPREISRAILSLLEGSSFVSWALSDDEVDQAGFDFILHNIIVN
ncbi:TetR family transcriptional regulator [Pseudomonas fluorescens]|uniref:TetR/AcrR family transcriptional regulator n=1 Tax=Pseudomonas atacamensis TaxID=2565368 RepID=UPI00099ABB45|nr:TetR family transcriptional regulator [Pseudomonas fluorescens]OPB12877.1 TetR family transcriptional regulator [Pseudomonas fluorescens]OPB25277.1 TetR family transcriptional regulator [Pseudomonas fluorescens]CAB1403687.1 Transcriptional regulator, TetR family [Pseudomonas fluorescens]